MIVGITGPLHDLGMISFIIPAHNEARLLGKTLAVLNESAREAEVPYEIIVVDDASTDTTAEIAAQANARVISVNHRHIAAVRNAGASNAQGDVFVFVDADTQIPAITLQAALGAMQAGAVGGGAQVRLLGHKSRATRWAESCLIWAFRLTRIAPGCFIFCTPEAFAKANGFDERYFAGEDVALSRALASQGRFVILQAPVWTSGRKLQTFTALEHLRLALRVAWRGRGLLQSRQHLELWYGERRHAEGEDGDAPPKSKRKSSTKF